MDSNQITRAFAKCRPDKPTNSKKIRASSAIQKKKEKVKRLHRSKPHSRLIILDSDEEESSHQEQVIIINQDDLEDEGLPISIGVMKTTKYHIDQQFDYDPSHLPIVQQNSTYYNPLSEKIKTTRSGLFDVHGPILPLGTAIKGNFRFTVPSQYLRNQQRKQLHGAHNIPILDLSKTIIDMCANRNDEQGMIGNDANIVDCQFSLSENSQDTDDGNFYTSIDFEEVDERAHPSTILDLKQPDQMRPSFFFQIDQALSMIQPQIKYHPHSAPSYTAKQTTEIKKLAKQIELLNYSELTRLKFWCASQGRMPTSILITTFFSPLMKGDTIQKFKTSAPDVDNMLRLLIEALYSHHVIHPDHLRHLHIQKIRCAHPLFAQPKETSKEMTKIRLFVD